MILNRQSESSFEIKVTVWGKGVSEMMKLTKLKQCHLDLVVLRSHSMSYSIKMLQMFELSYKPWLQAFWQSFSVLHELGCIA